MLVKGHSGFAVQLIDATTIRKSTDGPQADRLRRQIDRQIQFHKEARFERIHAPAIFHTAEGPGFFQADMEYIAADDFVEFLSEAGREELMEFLEMITAYLRKNLAASQEKDVAPLLRAKLEELAGKGVPARYVEAAQKRCSDSVSVPIGPCHGDLTLSNILFKGRGRRLYLVDFLDGFVDSPLQDIVKLRQDTAFAWSLQMYPVEFDITKTRLALAFLDRGLVAAFAAESWYRDFYELFQIVNLMRILPYCREAATEQLVLVSLDRLLAGKSG